MTIRHAAELTIRSVDLFTDALAYMNLAGQIERITVNFKDLKSLYCFVRNMQIGVREVYETPLNEPHDFKRDAGGLIYSDWTLLGVNYRFTCPERTIGYNIVPTTSDPVVQMMDEYADDPRRQEFWTKLGQKQRDLTDTGDGMTEERKRHP